VSSSVVACGAAERLDVAGGGDAEEDVASTDQSHVNGLGSVFPARSVALTENVCGPTDNPE
jgi:hypothetical protein